jgi:hypothetical protein
MMAVPRDCFEPGTPPDAGKAGAIVELLPVGRMGEPGLLRTSMGMNSYAVR